jgi:hypothetical protein
VAPVSRRRLHAPAYPDPTTGGLDEKLWNLLATTVEAAARGHAKKFDEQIDAFASKLSLQSQRLYGYYVYFLLKTAIIKDAGDAPNDAQIESLAARVGPDYTKLLPGAEASLLEVLRAPFGLHEKTLNGAEHTLFSTAALGALLRDPKRQLPEMRPALDAWCKKGASTIRRVCEQPDT